MEYYGISDVGNLREKNEDNFIEGLKVNDIIVSGVADGMGGHYGGDVASEIAVKTIREYILAQNIETESDFSKDKLAKYVRQAVERANKDIMSYKQQNPEFLEMGTTVTLGIFLENKGVIAHVGDSRAYIINSEAGISQITTDHSLVNQLYQQGKISSETAESHPQKNILTRALGTDYELQVDIEKLEIPDGSAVLFATDGLTDNLSDQEIFDILAEEQDYKNACEKMLTLSKQRGGHDNIKVTIVSNSDIAGIIKR